MFLNMAAPKKLQKKILGLIIKVTMARIQPAIGTLDKAP
jgi:hypothetical protein